MYGFTTLFTTATPLKLSPMRRRERFSCSRSTLFRTQSLEPQQLFLFSVKLLLGKYSAVEKLLELDQS